MTTVAYKQLTIGRPNFGLTARPAACSRRLKQLHRRRRGFTSVGTLLLIVIGIVTLMLVVNWTYLVLVNRHTIRLTDTLALSAVRELLDEGQLEDAPTFAQADDIADAKNAIVDPADGFLARNNEASGPSLRPTPADLTITAGRIDDASQPIAGSNAFVTPATHKEPYNTLRVEALRSATGLNPVQLIIRGFGAPEAAKISSASFATLDSRVVGFRPSVAVPSPVVPIALDQSAWFKARAEGMDDSQLPNGRFELDFTLRSVGGSGPFNAVVVGLKRGSPLNTAILPSQIENGIVPADLDSTGVLGPATPQRPLAFNASRNSPANVQDMADALNEIAVSTDPRRVFPIYSGLSQTQANINGFIAARIINADAANVGNGSRLRVRLEPEFIVHSTVVTARRDAVPSSVPENLYIHKIRLTR
jgi:hypothetical protein